MPLELGLAIVLAIVWSDSCKRHLWESIGPLHHFGCDCRGFRYYRRHDSSGRTFTFSHEPPPDMNDLEVIRQGVLDISIVEVAGPKASSSFVAAQLGDVVQCSLPLVATTTPTQTVQQSLRLPIPPGNTPTLRCARLFLYSRQSQPLGERLLAIARVPLDVTRSVGLHDVTVPFFNSDSKTNGHIRMLLRIGAAGSGGFLVQNLVPYVAEASPDAELGRERAEEGAGDAVASPSVSASGPIVVFSAGGKPCIAVHEDDEEALGGLEEELSIDRAASSGRAVLDAATSSKYGALRHQEPVV